MIPTSTLLMHLTDMMNRLRTSSHPEIEEFLEKNKNNAEFQMLACTARGLWKAMHNKTEFNEKGWNVLIGFYAFLCIAATSVIVYFVLS